MRGHPARGATRLAGPSVLIGPGDDERELAADLDLASEEGTLIEPLAPQPSGDLGVALARVARPACRDHVVERVAPPAGDGQDAVALERGTGHSAIRTSAPGSLQRLPLRVGQVVVDQTHATSAASRGHGAATPAHRHVASVGPSPARSWQVRTRGSAPLGWNPSLRTASR